MDTPVKTPAAPEDVKQWAESQGFVEKVIDMARKVTAEVEKDPSNMLAAQKLAKAKHAMAQGNWESAMQMFMDMVGGKGTVANKSTNLGDWAADVLSKATAPDHDDILSGQSLSEWSTSAIAKADNYAEVVVESVARESLYHEMYHYDRGLDDDLLCQHAATEAIVRCASSHPAELKSIVAKGGREAVVALCRRNLEQVKAIAGTRKKEAEPVTTGAYFD